MEVFQEENTAVLIKQGSVFYFVEESFHSKKPHYFVVLNREPLKDEGVALVCAVTLDIGAIERCERRGLEKVTLIDVTPEDCKFLKHVSLFDCNEIITKPVATLLSKLSTKKLLHCGTISQPILEKLRFGVHASRLVSGKVKKMLG